MLLHQHSAEIFVGFRGAEQHAVRHDHCRPAADLQKPEEQSEKQQLGLLRFDDLLQVLGRAS